jgi:dynein heavy chain
VQSIIEGKVEKRMKDVYGPPMGKRMILLLDDVNMPARDLFGLQPPLELLRLFLDYGFWYDRQKQFIKYVKDVQLLAVMGYPGGLLSLSEQSMCFICPSTT